MISPDHKKSTQQTVTVENSTPRPSSPMNVYQEIFNSEDTYCRDLADSSKIILTTLEDDSDSRLVIEAAKHCADIAAAGRNTLESYHLEPNATLKDGAKLACILLRAQLEGTLESVEWVTSRQEEIINFFTEHQKLNNTLKKI